MLNHKPRKKENECAKPNKNKIEISFPADFIKANVQPAPPL